MRQQLHLVGRATIAVSPPGGVSMILPFMPAGAHVILINYMTQERGKRVTRAAAAAAAVAAEGTNGAAEAKEAEGAEGACSSILLLLGGGSRGWRSQG